MPDKPDIEEAARILAGVGINRSPPTALPEGTRPATVGEAHAIQERLVQLSGETVGGWKVAINAEGQVTWGVIFARDCLASPAILDARRMPLLGVEGEVAFRFVADLPARSEPYSREEIWQVLAPFPAIEIVDTRFAGYQDAPALDRLADRMSNGGLIIGTAAEGVRERDLSALRVVLQRDGESLVENIGGHARGEPLLPVVDFIRARQATLGFAKGQVITAGTLTGIVFGKVGERYEVNFDGLGSAAVAFV